MDMAARSRWIERQVNGSARLRVFCFPYAGGSARIYRPWMNHFGTNLELCAIQLPGRERRLSEPALRRADQVVEILAEVLRPYLDLPFVLFGHSMGAVLAYEVARGLLQSLGMEPRALIVSGHRAPHLPSRRRVMHTLPHDELIAEIKALNGTPQEVFEHADLLNLVLPTLRSDFELVETYTKQQDPVLSCAVIAMSGSDDPEVLPDELIGWQSVTTGPFKTMLLEGDHFYLNNARSGIFEALAREFTRLGPL